MPESKLADRAAMYERALQNSVKLRSSAATTNASTSSSTQPRRPSTPTPAQPGPPSPSAAGPSRTFNETSAPRLEVGSALGESYDDAQPIFGEQRQAEEPLDEEFVDGGIMGLLGNIYEQRKGML